MSNGSDAFIWTLAPSAHLRELEFFKSLGRLTVFPIFQNREIGDAEQTIKRRNKEQGRAGQWYQAGHR